MPDQIFEKLVSSIGGTKILYALLKKGATYQSELSFDTRLHGITIARTLKILIELKLVRKIAPTRKIVHVETFYELTPYGESIAKLFLEHQEQMTRSLEKIGHDHHIK